MNFILEVLIVAVVWFVVMFLAYLAPGEGAIAALIASAMLTVAAFVIIGIFIGIGYLMLWLLS